MKNLLKAFCLFSISGGCLASPTIAVDVGHSHLHPGSISARGVNEFEFNVNLAGTLQNLLSSNGILVSMIGADGNMADIMKRTEQARSNGATFFLSIHHDSVQPKYLSTWQWQGVNRRYSDNFSGFSIFVSRKNPYSEKSLQCAKLIGQSLQSHGLMPSNFHSEAIPHENRQWADQQAGVYYYDDLIVLKTARMPAVLVEAGVIVNRKEEVILQKDETRLLISKSIAQGLNECHVLF